MSQNAKLKAKLILEDGTEFFGYSFGSNISTSGEVVFNTGMVGYPETLSDPSYTGQILTLTTPMVGNYGIPNNEIDEHNINKFFESDKIHVKGLIISDYSNEYSHWNAKKSLGQWLKEHNTPAIYGIDTRALTKKLRESGVMLGKIIIDEKKIEQYNPEKENQVAKVSTKKTIIYTPPNNDIKRRCLLVDCGVKNNIIRNFLKRGVEVKSVPWDYDFTKENYDGLFISNGPGDPKFCKATIEYLKVALKQNKPIFGICLGSQLLALASGANTYKLKYGHRSHNQPCTDTETNKCYITSQNHGYAIDDKTLNSQWKIWFKNANDGTNEGIKHKTKPFFAVQFHPEAMAGPDDTEFLFDKFIKLL